jgi:hypothetical protein
LTLEEKERAIAQAMGALTDGVKDDLTKWSNGMSLVSVRSRDEGDEEADNHRIMIEAYLTLGDALRLRS